VPADAVDEVKPRALPGELDKVADAVRAPREWFRGVVSKHMGRRLPPRALQELGPLNQLLERDEAFSQTSRHHQRDEARLELRAMRRPKSGRQVVQHGDMRQSRQTGCTVTGSGTSTKKLTDSISGEMTNRSPMTCRLFP
jgi:hypothetical protein